MFGVYTPLKYNREAEKSTQKKNLNIAKQNDSFPNSSFSENQNEFSN